MPQSLSYWDPQKQEEWSRVYRLRNSEIVKAAEIEIIWTFKCTMFYYKTLRTYKFTEVTEEQTASILSVIRGSSFLRNVGEKFTVSFHRSVRRFNFFAVITERIAYPTNFKCDFSIKEMCI
jgi:hypothetical protein